MKTLATFLAVTWKSTGGRISLCVFGFCLLLAVVGPWLAPHGPSERLYDEAGKLLRLSPPTWQHPLGTTVLGRDVFSQMLWGARTAMTVGPVS